MADRRRGWRRRTETTTTNTGGVRSKGRRGRGRPCRCDAGGGDGDVGRRTGTAVGAAEGDVDEEEGEAGAAAAVSGRRRAAVGVDGDVTVPREGTAASANALGAANGRQEAVQWRRCHWTPVGTRLRWSPRETEAMPVEGKQLRRRGRRRRGRPAHGHDSRGGWRRGEGAGHGRGRNGGGKGGRRPWKVAGDTMLVIMRIPCLAFPSSLPPNAFDYDIPLTKGTKIDNLPLTASF
uniref:Retrotransposon protein, putative, Ty3-gypsy subclass n=1 Tax=Oryza sativa subsp. japonica TaxID=39947 RepID=Q6Z5R6_ORYSJ|nr:hypothetical protein [Oryza sativa Japonica Group]